MNKLQKLVARLVFGSSLSEHARAFISGDDLPGTYIPLDSDTAMKYSAVFACVRVLSETLAAAPAIMYQKKPNGDREVIANHRIYDILHNAPNEEMSPFNFKEACMTALNLGGNSVSERLVNARGELVGLYPYKWQMVRIERDKDTGQLLYRIKWGANEKILTRSQVFHISGVSIDGVVGLSPIEYASAAIRLGLSYEQFGVSFYKNGMNPSIALEYPGTLGEPAYERLKKDIAKNHGGLFNTGKPLLVEDGAKVKELTIKPVDAQLLESKRFQVEDVARIYRVPLHLIQELSRSTNNNIEKQSLEFVMYTMLPWFKRWEENINMQLLTPRERMAGLYIEFKIDSLLRGDAKSRAFAYATGRQWGYLSVNDIRKLENMNPVPNGDIYLQPMNMIEAGQEPPAKTSQALAGHIYNMIQKGGKGYEKILELQGQK